jgi:Flp pilus assembly protein TadG
MRSHTSRGQTFVEFALLLPLLLLLLGGAIDLARVFQASITLESAVRNAAEYVASSKTDVSADGVRIVCTETAELTGFQGSATNCTQPAVTVTWSSDPTLPGATATYPIGTSTVTAAFDFSMLFGWPMLNQGAWTLQSEATFTMVQGR